MIDPGTIEELKAELLRPKPDLVRELRQSRIPVAILDYIDRSPAASDPLLSKLTDQARIQATFTALPHKNYEGHSYARLALALAEAHDALLQAAEETERLRAENAELRAFAMGAPDKGAPPPPPPPLTDKQRKRIAAELRSLQEEYGTAAQNAKLRAALEDIAWATPEKTAFAPDKLWEVLTVTARKALSPTETGGAGSQGTGTAQEVKA